MDQRAIDYTYDARRRLVSEVVRSPGGRVRRELRIAY
jgi:YD repeat-containing protein